MARERPLTWAVALRLRLTPYYVWAAFTPIIFRLGKRFALTDARRLTHAAIHVFIGTGIVLAYLILNSLTIALTESIPLTPGWLLRNYVKHLVGSFHVYYMMYWAILAAGYAFDPHRNARAQSSDITYPPESANSVQQFVQRIEVKESGHILYLPVEDIEWLQAVDHYVEIRAAGKTHLLPQTLGKLEKTLYPNQIVRIHRSTIVNVGYVRELQPFSRDEYVVILEDGSQLKVSRSRREKLQNILRFTP